MTLVATILVFSLRVIGKVALSTTTLALSTDVLAQRAILCRPTKEQIESFQHNKKSRLVFETHYQTHFYSPSELSTYPASLENYPEHQFCIIYTLQPHILKLPYLHMYLPLLWISNLLQLKLHSIAHKLNSTFSNTKLDHLEV